MEQKIDCIGMIESRSVAQGLGMADRMLKASGVKLLYASVLCPGKYIAMVSGDISAVEEALTAAKQESSEFLLGSELIADVHPAVFSALAATGQPLRGDTLGVIETSDAVSAVMIADRSVKSADIALMEVRLARGMGGKAFIFLSGELASVQEAVKCGIHAIDESGMLISWVIIPNASPEIFI